MSLLQALADLEKVGLEYDDFAHMSAAICKAHSTELVSQRYLYDLYWRTMEKLETGVEISRPRGYLIDLIAKHLGYPSFRHFVIRGETAISPSLQACMGTWWSYVRANAGERLLKAPVRIFQDENKNLVKMEMRTKGRIFKGLAHENIGCLTAYLDSGNGKKLALVFKLGNAPYFELLQGVFSGISSPGDPISGRELLLRETDLAFDDMHWEELLLTDGTTDSRIRNYFSDYGQNCIKIREVSSFTLSDLELART